MAKSSAKRRKARGNPGPRAEAAALGKLIHEARLLSHHGRGQDACRLLMDSFERFGHHPLWLAQMGFACLDTRRTDEAEFYLQRAIAKDPDCAPAHSYLGFFYFETADFPKSIEHHKRAIELDPKSWNYYVNLSQTAERMGLYEQALAALTVAFQLKPNEPRVMWEMANLYLSNGQIENGWKLYEAGFGCGKRVDLLPRRDRYWGGEDISDQTILVWREHGIGDEIRNADLYHDLVAVAGRTIIECEPRLESIFRRSFPGAEILPEASPPSATERPEFDVHSGQFSLHYHFRKSITAYREKARPDGFLLPDPGRVAFWRERFRSLGGRAVVGLSWRSQLAFKQRTHNYFALAELRDLLQAPDVTFVNLFYGDAEEEIREVEQSLGITIHRWSDVDLKNDMEAVFAMTRALDLLISAPTSSADIGGAVGTPVWTVLPKKHYIRLGEADVPQLPSLRIYDRQLNEPWGPTLRRITADFYAWLKETAATPAAAPRKRA
ncbi:MAG: tetratricopeptide repeat protein [Rhodothalassiaceae bacterium]